MHYLNVKLLGQEIEDHFTKRGRTCHIHLGITTYGILALKMQEFGQQDFNDIQAIAVRHNVIVVKWSAHYPGPHYPHLIVSLSLSEVQKNGKPG